MNTEQKQAIAYLEECIQRQNSWCDYTGVKEMRLAIEALREKAKREKGCEYCDGVPSRYKATRAEGFYKIYKIAIDEIYNPKIPVNYCPMCGRKLDHNWRKESR